MKPILSLFFCSAAMWAQIETVRVQAGQPERTVHLPGEMEPFEAVELFARVNGYVDRVLVDRGSAVRRGQLLVELSAPELQAQVAEGEARVAVIESQRAEAAARLASAEATFSKLKKASETAGAISGNELVTADKTVAAASALVASFESSKNAAKESLNALKQTQSYLRVTAPFSGSVADRRVHPGALVGPTQNPAAPGMLRIEQTTRLRLVVAVPEAHVGGIVRGVRVPFTVSAYPGETFSGTIARIGSSVNPKTRTMPVELDVSNSGNRLASGMYPDVAWPIRRRQVSLLVPPTAVVVTTERTIVIRVVNQHAEWTNVKKGAAEGDLIEVSGDLHPGDIIIRRATDEIRNGSAISTKPSAAS